MRIGRVRIGHRLVPNIALRLRPQLRIGFDRFRALIPEPVRNTLATLTPNGWAASVGMLVSLAIVFTLGWIEAGVLAIICAVCLLVGVVSVVGRAKYQVEITLPVTRTVAGTTAINTVSVRNIRNAATGSGVLEIPIAFPHGESVAQFLVPALGVSETWSTAFAILAENRGVVLIGPARSVRSDGLGMLRRLHRWAEPVKLYVNPKTIRVPFDAAGYQLDAEGVTTAKLSSSDVSFHALRDYSPGDDRRFVHWPTTARMGKLIVRQFEETRRSHHLILLDTDRRHYTPAAFETAVSIAASLARSGIRDASQVKVATSTRWISATSSANMLNDLTEIVLEDVSQDLALRLRQVLLQSPGISVLTVITGAQASVSDIGRWTLTSGVEVKNQVIRVSPDVSARRNTAGRGIVIDCPDLEELPRVLQQIEAR